MGLDVQIMNRWISSDQATIWSLVIYDRRNPKSRGAIPLTTNLGRGEDIPGLERGLVGRKKVVSGGKNLCSIRTLVHESVAKIEFIVLYSDIP